MKHRVALLSNVNMNFVVRMLAKEQDVYAGEGYGNEIGLMMDQASSYRDFDGEVTFLLMDLLEVINHELELSVATSYIEKWFSLFEACILPGKIYYVSDAYLWGPELAAVPDVSVKETLEYLWLNRLKQCMDKYNNVRIFKYRSIVETMGQEQAFSLKLWYMGKILHTNEAQKRIAEEILRCVELENKVAKKVLVLDLDNTLWGGLAGEHDITPIMLSDDHGGLAYKNLQRVIAQMQKSGVILAICSKNNIPDAMEIIENHPHMILRSSAFASKRINWNLKSDNLKEIAAELNLGLDSFVFFDDSETERELVKQMLPQVAVPEFPAKPEDLAPAMGEIFKTYFQKPVITAEDTEKTKQYEDNAKRVQMQEAATSFEDYLKELAIKVERVDGTANLERLHQLVNKTNQFNLTTKRYTMEEMQKIVADSAKKVYLYRIEDKFGDYGIVAALIVDVSNVPTIEEFVLSCRVMGKNVEYGILTAVEKDLQAFGFEKLYGLYIPTAKNMPVEKLYEKAGYTFVGKRFDTSMYALDLTQIPTREYYLEIIS